MTEVPDKSGIWFVYDGACPLCESAALALRIKEQYGPLHLLNARQHLDHPLINEINAQGFDIDEGMIIYDGSRFYHGKNALSFMAKFGDSKGVFNNINRALFRSDNIASILYPLLRGIRNLLLRRRGVGRIDNLNMKSVPIFQDVFGDAWHDLPVVMKKHYANRPYSNDVTTVAGHLDVMCAGPIKLFSSLFWLMKGIPPHNESNVPVTVHFESNKVTKEFRFNRIFYFKNRNSYSFQSRMIQTSGNEVIEMMRFGLGWKMSYTWEDGCVKLKHKGYVVALLGYFIPVPISFLMGQGDAKEQAIDDDTFDMHVEITHPWWGKIYEYKGRFTIKDKG